MAKKKEKLEKPSFVLYTEHIEQFDSLSDAQAGQLIKAILHYVADGEIHIKDPVVSAMMMFIRQTLDRDRKKWEETRQKRVEAGKKGGEESAKRRKELEANAAFAEANQAVNVNVNEYGNVHVNANENENVNVNENVVVSVNNNYDYYCTPANIAEDGTTTTDFIPYGRERYLTTPAELQKIQALADELMYTYRNKKPTPDDYEKVFYYVHTIAVNDVGEHYGIYSEEKADLLRHVFEEASLRSDMNWQYINRIYATYSQYGVKTVEDAIDYENWWNNSQIV